MTRTIPLSLIPRKEERPSGAVAQPVWAEELYRESLTRRNDREDCLIERIGVWQTCLFHPVFLKNMSNSFKYIRRDLKGARR